MKTRSFSPIDQLLVTASHALETLFTEPVAQRPYPGRSNDSETLTDSERSQAARYMRINHVGEICAQALYESQALTASSPDTVLQMQKSSREEQDHLAWCEQRIKELGGRKSILNPIWYGGAFAIGAVAGLAGDKWSLGFVAETEHQVVAHLEDHLGRLPEHDSRSKEVICQMQIDENAHKETAVENGAASLPKPVTSMMKLASKVMTKTAYWI